MSQRVVPVLLLALLSACAGPPPEDFDGDAPICVTQTVQFPDLESRGGWANAAPMAGEFWACDGVGGDHIAVDPETDDRPWVLGCFSDNARAYRGAGLGAGGGPDPRRIIVVDELAPQSVDLIDECYVELSTVPSCFVGGTARGLLACDSLDVWGCPEADGLALRCLYVHAEP